MNEHDKTLRLERLACLVQRSVEDADGLIDLLIEKRATYSARIAELVERMEGAADAAAFQESYDQAHRLTVDLLKDTQARLDPGSVVEVHLAFLPACFSEN